MPGSKPKIPPALHALVMKLAGEGKNSEEIAELLWREHKVEAGARAVRRLIERDRTERADIAKSVVREELRKHLIPAVRRVARVMARARFAERCAQEVGDIPTALKAQDRQLKAANVLLHYAGLNQPDQPGAPSPQTDRDALLERLRKLAGAAEPTTEPPVH